MSTHKRVAIIDYKMGNLYSVQNACRHVGLESVITTDKDFILSADAAILPGVGAFGQAMKHLQQLQLVEVIHEFINLGRPFMGICLGFQLLFSTSEEFGSTTGLNLIEGKVKKFPVTRNGQKVKVPQVGWNRIYFSGLRERMGKKHPLGDISEGSYLYFVHSYYAVPENQNLILTKTDYAGIEYCSSILKDNILGTQFHPEKSGNLGIQIYKKWASEI